MNRRKGINWLLIIMLACAGHAGAQSFHNTARIDPVSAPGFYAITVSPMLSALVKTDYSDLRIRDEAGNPVPYLLESALPELHRERYREMKLEADFVDDSGNNVVVVGNPATERLDGFSLVIQNAAVSRTIDLAGSNDTLRWFSIVEHVGLEQRFIQDSDRFSEELSFPLSSYKYFRVIIRNGRNRPLRIVSANRRVNERRQPSPVALTNPALIFSSKDSSQFTIVSIKNPLHVHISQITLRVNTPRFFQRSIVCYAAGRQAGSFQVSRDSLLRLSLPLLNDSLITLQIFNGDNPALKITAISTQQYQEKIITYLEPGKAYVLEMTAERIAAPHYDLIHFRDSIPDSVPAIGISSPRPVRGNPVTAGKQNANGWLWPCLIFVVIVLGLSVYQLTKDMDKK